MIRVGEVFQAQSCHKMLMPEAKGLSHVRTRVCLEGPGWLQLAAVTQEGTQLTGPEYLTPLSLSQLICKSENHKATFFMGVVMRLNEARHVQNSTVPARESSL